MKEKRAEKSITNAMFSLLAVKPLSEISVTELITKAGVCRSSYYRNYYLLEDVIKKYSQELSARIFQLPPASLDDLPSHMQQVYEIYLAERERLTILDKRNLFYLMDDKLYELCATQIQRLDMSLGRYQTEIYAGASAYLIRAWVHRGFQESPAELAEISTALIMRYSR